MAVAGAVVAIAGGLTFGLIVAWLHIRRSDLDSRIKGISHYAIGETHRATVGAFVALSLGLCGAVVALGARTGTWMDSGALLVGLAALGLLVVAAVPVPGAHDARWRGPVHNGGALAFLVASSAGAVLVSRVVGGLAPGISLVLGALLSCFLLGMAGVPGLFGIRGWLQRGCFAGVVAWLVVAGWQLAS